MTRPDAVGETLLRAASEVLAHDGPSALTVRRIATEAGVSTMNVYSRFGGKDGVVEHLFVEGFSRLREAMDSAGTTDDPLADLHRCALGYRTFALANPTYYAVMFEAVVPDFVPSREAAEHASGTLHLLADLVRRAIDAGVVRHDDALQLAGALWATCHGVVSLELRSVGPDGLDWATIHTVATSAMLDGLSAAP